MAKQCNHIECENPVWGKGYCKFHQHLRTDKKPKTFKPRKPIPKFSKTRRKTQPEYKKMCDEIDAEAKANNTYVCIFCNKMIVGTADHHHLIGRDGDLYTDKAYVVLAHNKCHVWEWHAFGTAQLMELPWYEEFKQRLKDDYPLAYDKVMYREEKYLESINHKSNQK